MKCNRAHLWLAPAWACVCVALGAPGQTFTNSATLSTALDGTGTNLAISYSMATTQGWVTLFSAGSPAALATSPQPVDLQQVPPSMQGQFLVPIPQGAPAQFYRLLIEQWPSRGKALVFINGPLDFDAMLATYGAITNNSQGSTPMIFRQPVQVWIYNLGAYDTTGVLVGSNQGLLHGKYAVTSVLSLNASGFPPISDLNSPGNDFRVNYLGDANVNEREGVIWSSEAQFYHDVNDYRNRFLNDSFIDSLSLPSALAANVKSHQFRPDLSMGGGERHLEPVLAILEDETAALQQVLPVANAESTPLRTRGPYQNYATQPPLSFVYDTESVLRDYSFLVQFWLLGTNGGFPYETNFEADWTHNILAALGEGIGNWCAYRYSGNPEIFRYWSYALRIWTAVPCGGTNLSCAKGQNIRNVMMADLPSNTSADGVFPFSPPTGVSNANGPVGASLAEMFIAAVFYDIANEAGLGVYKTDQIAWKTVSLITNNTQFTIADFGRTVQQAARQIWPDPRPGRAGLSLYEEDLVDVLTSRGIPMNGVSDFKTNLPPALGPTLRAATTQSSHPNAQPAVNQYGTFQRGTDEYTTPGLPAAYVAYTFYKHSKYGPCDYIELQQADGTYTGAIPNPDGTVVWRGVDRDLGNTTVFVPSVSAKSNTVRIVTYRGRCANEATGFYAEDVRPFGFIITQATPSGFSFTASALSSNATFKTYQLSIVDPSTNTLGAASYNWTFTDYVGNTYPVTGPVVQYPAYVDEPFTISIDRVRGGVTNNLTLRERGNDLDRSSGQAFVRNFVH